MTHRMTRQLNGQSVGAVGLGCMSFGGIYGSTDEAESLACLQAALDAGIDHWDVAEIYGMGISERVIGTFLRLSNAQITLATKAGIYPKPTRHFRNDYDSLRASLEGSLERLGRDKVELFYVHRREAERPVEEVMEGLARLKEEGLIDAVGLSEVAPSTLRRAHAVMPIAAVQSEYSLWTRLPELGLIQTCAELGVTFVAFSPLGRGVFTDHTPDPTTFSAEDFRGANPRFIEPNYSANRTYIDAFQAFCASRGWSTAATALAWTLAQGTHILPIPGTRSATNLKACAQAMELELSADDLLEIERILPAGFAHGDRYASTQLAGVEYYC